MLLSPHPWSKASAYIVMVESLISADRKGELSQRSKATATKIPYDNRAGKTQWEYCLNSSKLDREP